MSTDPRASRTAARKKRLGLRGRAGKPAAATPRARRAAKKTAKTTARKAAPTAARPAARKKKTATARKARRPAPRKTTAAPRKRAGRSIAAVAEREQLATRDVKRRIRTVKPMLSGHELRIWVAAEAVVAGGPSGIGRVARATGWSRDAVSEAVQEFKMIAQEAGHSRAEFEKAVREARAALKNAQRR